MKRWTVLDKETTIRNTGEDAVGSFQASPFSIHNFIVAYGELHEYAPHEPELHYSATGDVPAPSSVQRAAGGEQVMLVGHNIGFDLSYMWKTWPELMEQAAPNLFIWDTQQVEYLLSGQSELYPSLDECCEKRGLPLKDDEIKALWAQGVDTPLHPKEKLLDYLSGDLFNTRDVFLDQLDAVNANPALRELVEVKMDDLLATTMMSWNGMKFDLELAYNKLAELDARRTPLEQELLAVMQPQFPEDFEVLLSPDQISLTLFGGKWKYKKPVEQRDPETGELLHYKSGQKAGQVKTRIETVQFAVKGLGFKPDKLAIPALKNGNWSTDSEHMAKIDCDFAKKVLEYRELDKDSETYYRGYSSLVWFDGCLHPNRNHEGTRTGRLSCSNPNLENVTKDDD